MNLLEALWKSDGRKKPNQNDIEALYEMIQANEKRLGEETTFNALLALARFASLLGFPKSGHSTERSIEARATEQFLDKAGVAQLLNVSERTVNALMASRILPFYRIKRIVRFRVADVIRAMEVYHVQ